MQITEGVRPEYKHVHDYIGYMAEDFERPFSDDEMEDVKMLFQAMECIDRYIDAFKEMNQIDDAFEKIITYLQSDSGSDEFPPELESHLMKLKLMLARSERKDEFLAHVMKIRDLTHVLRLTQDTHEYIMRCIEEGEVTADLTVAVTDKNRRSEEFEEFFRIAGGTGNLIDSIYDAHADYQNGEMTLKPDIKFYLEAILKASTGLIKLFLKYPQKFKRLALIRKFWTQFSLRRKV